MGEGRRGAPCKEISQISEYIKGTEMLVYYSQRKLEFLVELELEVFA